MSRISMAFLLLILAPLIEELLFRLGLSFRRIHIAITAAILPVFFVYGPITFVSGPTAAIISLVLFTAVRFFTTGEQWDRRRVRGLHPAVWIAAILFGAIHLKAFTVLFLTTLPFILCLCLITFLSDAFCTYYRINPGFRWGMAAHVANNIPPVISMFLMAAIGT